VTDLLSQLRLASGVPFGMLFILAGLGGLTVLGVIGAFWLRRRPLRVAALLLAGLAGGRLALGIASAVLVQEDLNPTVHPADLVGSWRDGAQVLTLRADRTFQITGPMASAGTWAFLDWELSFAGTKARVIKVNGALRIVPSFPEDPDLWDGRLGFVREVPR
jgi:hypothetical protein